jgi:hypothetical protein
MACRSAGAASAGKATWCGHLRKIWLLMISPLRVWLSTLPAHCDRCSVGRPALYSLNSVSTSASLRYRASSRRWPAAPRRRRAAPAPNKSLRRSAPRRRSGSRLAACWLTALVTVLGSPQAEPAQPRPLIGGHLVSTLVGLLIVHLFGPAPWAAALAVGLAMVAMHLTANFTRRPGSIHWWSLLTTCPGPSSSRQSASVRFRPRCLPMPGTGWSREAPTGVTRGLQGGGEAAG